MTVYESRPGLVLPLPSLGEFVISSCLDQTLGCEYALQYKLCVRDVDYLIATLQTKNSKD